MSLLELSDKFENELDKEFPLFWKYISFNLTISGEKALGEKVRLNGLMLLSILDEKLLLDETGVGERLLVFIVNPNADITLLASLLSVCIEWLLNPLLFLLILIESSASSPLETLKLL